MRGVGTLPQGMKPTMANALQHSPVIAKLIAMREELRQLWTRTNVSAEQLVADLQAWCRKAELDVLKEKGADLSPLKAAKRWLHRDDDKVPAAARPQLAQARAAHPVLDKMVTMPVPSHSQKRK